MKKSTFQKLLTWFAEPFSSLKPIFIPLGLSAAPYVSAALGRLSKFFYKLAQPFTRVSSIIGVLLVATVFIQLLTGFYLSWYYIPEVGAVVELREEVFNESRFGREFFLTHSGTVDITMGLLYIHIFKKISARAYLLVASELWTTGTYGFFWVHYMAILGFILSASAFGDLLLTIIANTFCSIFGDAYNSHYIVFTNKHLSTDQLVRVMIFHYMAPSFYFYLVQIHLHFSRKLWLISDVDVEKVSRAEIAPSWLLDSLIRELHRAFGSYSAAVSALCALSVGIVLAGVALLDRWGFVEADGAPGCATPIRWYCRPIFGLLLAAPTHAEGLVWVVMFFAALASLPMVGSWLHSGEARTRLYLSGVSAFQRICFALFAVSVVCMLTVLPDVKFVLGEISCASMALLKFAHWYYFIYLFVIVHLDGDFGGRIACFLRRVFSALKRAIAFALRPVLGVCRWVGAAIKPLRRVGGLRRRFWWK